MDQPTTRFAPYGSWRSPITADRIVAATVRLGQVALDGTTVYWTELRPSEGGRQVLVRWDADGTTRDVTPPPFNVRTRAHEYGGGAFAVADGVVYFANDADQRLYRQAPGAAPEPLTPAGAWRYADLAIDPSREHLLCVREDHSTADQHPTNTLVSIPLHSPDESPGQILVEGNDFYAAPRLSPDGTRLAWLTWNHPNMPWDGTELWVGDLLPDGTLGAHTRVAGGRAESVVQPQWSPDGGLHYASDRGGWWNLYRSVEPAPGQHAPLHPLDAEFSLPPWLFGTATYAFAADGRIVCSYWQQGIAHLASLDPASGSLTPLAPEYTAIDHLCAAGDRLVFVGATPTTLPAVVALDLATGQPTILKKSGDLALDAGYLSTPRVLEFPSAGGRTAYAFYYPPRNRDFVAPVGTKPPLLVKSHGGPTSATTNALNLAIQYWTSRGFAVLDVNYGGSTGYGREYRRRLNGQWGIVDVEDCVHGAMTLVVREEVDSRQLAITGGSAGGFTTLCALTFHDLFQAGASHYGIGDLEALARDTHKFESRYLDNLVGPFPRRRDLYYHRSPIHFTDQLACPVIFFQGLEDRVVPPSQAEAMVAALRARGLPVAYLTFPGEQHGFRRAEHIKRALEAELYFYGRIFGFTPADRIEPVPIDHL